MKNSVCNMNKWGNKALLLLKRLTYLNGREMPGGTLENHGKISLFINIFVILANHVTILADISYQNI